MPDLQLEPRHLAAVKEILAEHVPGCEIRVFGSRATGAAKPFSDLDLAILSADPLEARTLRRLKESFEDSDLPFRVDVLDWTSISERFRRTIDERHVVLQVASPRPPAEAEKE